MNEQVDLEIAGLQRKAFRGYGPRPVYTDEHFDLHDLLTPRARRWLEYQTDEEQQRFLATCAANSKHFRRLHWDERSTLAEWSRTRDMSDEEYAKHQAFRRDASKALGGLMAQQLYEAANRPGFLRRFFAPPEHTVPEAKPAEFNLARRLQRRLRPLRPLRAIIQQLHSHPVK